MISALGLRKIRSREVQQEVVSMSVLWWLLPMAIIIVGTLSKI